MNEQKEIRYVQTNALIPYARNARRHSQKQIAQIASSIKEFGFNQPIVIDKENIIRVGHGRFEAALLLNLTSVPTIILDSLSPEQIRAYAVVDNRLAELSEWDDELLNFELSELKDVLAADDYDLIIKEFGETNPDEEWQDMPEFENEDQNPELSIVVKFYNKEDRAAFAKLVQQNITEDTKTIYYPKQEREDKLAMEYK